MALFAALSYAVTQSGRGGGGIDREQLELDITELLNQANTIRSYYQRHELFPEFDQIKMTDRPPTTGGSNTLDQVVLLDGTRVSGTTVGIFHQPTTGIPYLLPPLTLMQSGSVQNQFGWRVHHNRRLQTAPGIDLGTSAPDTVLDLAFIDLDVCDIINTRLNNTNAPIANNTSGSFYARGEVARRDKSQGLLDSDLIRAPASGSISYPGCSALSTAGGIRLFAMPLIIR